MSEKRIDLRQARVDAERAIVGVATAKQTITTIRGALRRDMPEVMAELEDAEQALPGLQEAAKVTLRLLGPGDHDLVGHTVSVKTAPMKTKCDVEGIVDMAITKGELQDLLDAGVLKYDVVPHQIGRLSGLMKVRYEGFLTQEAGTPAVSLPAELK